MTPFFRANAVLYQKFGNMVIFTPGKLILTLELRKPALSENYWFLFFFMKEGKNRRQKFDNIIDTS